MDKEYVIKINLTPAHHDNPHEPYFWCILGYHDNWCNEGSGWSATPESAFQDALDYYNRCQGDKSSP
ncbi:hypothetical protein SAMN05661086_03056 [Anaeromicropila populeti]|uniref:Uncharacterized protein n=1 Tax=Anaeromicropila populeti TaxID=37658 RepID=A0A1I6L504_9FIRM|nr:hypothetical protein SAMN05661086_03056 [Anaeromicropila populeti]